MAPLPSPLLAWLDSQSQGGASNCHLSRAMVVPSTPSQLRRSRPSILTTRSPGLTMATEAQPHLRTLSLPGSLLRGWPSPFCLHFLAMCQPFGPQRPGQPGLWELKAWYALQFLCLGFLPLGHNLGPLYSASGGPKEWQDTLSPLGLIRALGYSHLWPDCSFATAIPKDTWEEAPQGLAQGVTQYLVPCGQARPEIHRCPFPELTPRFPAGKPSGHCLGQLILAVTGPWIHLGGFSCGQRDC